MKRPDFSTLAGSIRAVLLSIRKFFNQYRRQFLILVGALALVVILALGFSVVTVFIARGTQSSMADPDMAHGYSLKGARVLRDLYMPGPAVGETPFPLAFEPDPGYTDEGVLRLDNDMSGIDVGTLSTKRKAALEAIYDALD